MFFFSVFFFSFLTFFSVVVDDPARDASFVVNPSGGGQRFVKNRHQKRQTRDAAESGICQSRILENSKLLPAQLKVLVWVFSRGNICITQMKSWFPRS